MAEGDRRRDVGAGSGTEGEPQEAQVEDPGESVSEAGGGPFSPEGRSEVPDDLSGEAGDAAAEARGEREPEGELEVLRRERDELVADLKRVHADFENFRKRIMREQALHMERATEQLVEQLLPILDSFELALLSAPDAGEEGAAAKLVKGFELVYAELLGVLEKAGLERIEAAGKPFDPNEHEAVLREEGEGEPVVIEVLRSGYRFRGRVLRPAMVKVGR